MRIASWRRETRPKSHLRGASGRRWRFRGEVLERMWERRLMGPWVGGLDRQIRKRGKQRRMERITPQRMKV